MSELVGKTLAKLIAIVVIAGFVLGFREAVLTDKTLSAAFGGLMGAIPFAKLITDQVCRILKYGNSIPVISGTSVLADLLKLAVMALIQGPVIGFLTSIFLKVPSSGQEDYMKSAGYSAKSMIFKIVTAPFLAVAAAWISDWLLTWIQGSFGVAASAFLGIGTVSAAVLLSTLWLIRAGLSFGQALLWRLTITLGGKMTFTFLINAICLLIYVALLGGVEEAVWIAIISLILVLMVEELAMDLMKRAIVG